MSMSSDIRVRTDDRFGSLYNDLKGLVVSEFHELFFLCACIGYKNGKRKSLGKSGKDRFWSGTIEPQEYAAFYAMVADEKKMNFSTIQDDKTVIKIMEEYANSGMDILLDDFLNDYLVKNSDELRVDKSVSKDLPKVFLHYVYERLQDIYQGKE